jgi:predicted  nucleic acid-binding Zn-ribbon protein
MSTNKNPKHMNAAPGDPVIGHVKDRTSQRDNHSAINIENQELKRQMKNLEESLTDRLNEEGLLITQLQHKIEILEEQVTQHKTQIKQLEDKVMSKSKVQLKNKHRHTVHAKGQALVFKGRRIDNKIIKIQLSNDRQL